MRPSIVVATLCIAGLGAPSLLAATLEIPKTQAGLLGDHHSGAGHRHDQDQGVGRPRRRSGDARAGIFHLEMGGEKRRRQREA